MTPNRQYRKREVKNADVSRRRENRGPEEVAQLKPSASSGIDLCVDVNIYHDSLTNMQLSRVGNMCRNEAR